ncbi:MAG TPA: DNA-binding protein WhiA, partial [Marmoricola sp.]|nr:DNA-binding protein WhiA [Marmoricola sp.]
MALTAQVKAELANCKVSKSCCRKAEVSAMLRFSDSLHLVNNSIVVEAELDTGAAARRLRTDIFDMYGVQPEMVMVKGSGLRKAARYLVRVSKDGAA